MDDADKNLINGDEQEKAPEDESASLKGMGWDILVGGEEHALNMGGKDPFDLEAATTEETAEIFVSSAEITSEPEVEEEPEPMRADAFWDRGRGAEVPEPPDLETPGSAVPPRDLSPEELGASPAEIDLIVPSPGVSAEVIGADVAPSTPSVEVPSIPIADLTKPTESIPGEDVAVGAPVPTEASADGVEKPPSPAIETAVPFSEELSGPQPFASETTEAAPFSTGAAGDVAAGTSDAVLPTYPPPISTISAGAMAGGQMYPSASVLPTSFYKPSDPFYEPPRTRARPADEPDMTPDEELEKKLITDEAIENLWKEIDETYRLVISDVRGYFSTTELSLSELKKAREYLLAGREYFDNAEELVKRVKARLRLEDKVRKWAQTRGAWLGIYLVVWLFLVLAMAIMSDRITSTLNTVMPVWLAASFMPGMFGSLGGVIGALWVLIKHIAKLRDFDPIHTPWYVTNPFMGFALGMIAYLLVSSAGGLFGIDSTMTVETVSPAGIFSIYALCVVVGFNQNVLWSMVDRVIKAVIPPEDTSPTVEATPPEAEG